jgi:hypothetical protein
VGIELMSMPKINSRNFSFIDRNGTMHLADKVSAYMREIYKEQRETKSCTNYESG